MNIRSFTNADGTVYAVVNLDNVIWAAPNPAGSLNLYGSHKEIVARVSQKQLEAALPGTPWRKFTGNGTFAYVNFKKVTWAAPNPGGSITLYGNHKEIITKVSQKQFDAAVASLR